MKQLSCFKTNLPLVAEVCSSHTQPWSFGQVRQQETNPRTEKRKEKYINEWLFLFHGGRPMLGGRHKIFSVRQRIRALGLREAENVCQNEQICMQMYVCV